MRRFILIVVGASALLSPVIMFPARQPGVVSGGEIFAALMFYPCIIASVVGLIVGFFDVMLSGEHRGSSILLAVLSLVLPATMVAKKLQHEANYDGRYAWFDQTSGGGLINFYLYRYVQEHPSSVTYINDSEEVDAPGLIPILQAAAPLYMRDEEGRTRKIRITSDGVFTPWGARVHFAVDRNHDGFVTAGGQRGGTKYGYADPYRDYGSNYTYSSATGVFLALPDKILGQTDSSLVTLDSNDYERLAPIVFSTALK